MAEATKSVFQLYYDWLFDGNIKSEIPEEILKSTSPINNKYVISVFINNLKLNLYLNIYFNNINLWYLEKEDLFIFLKKCVKDFRINRRDLVYIPWKKTTKIFDELRKKSPNLKKYEISLLCELIEKMENKDNIYSSLGVEKVDKTKVKKQKNKSDKTKVKDFIDNNFKIISV